MTNHLCCCHFCSHWDSEGFLLGECSKTNKNTVHFYSCNDFKNYLDNIATVCMEEDSQYWRREVTWKQCETCKFYTTCWQD